MKFIWLLTSSLAALWTLLEVLLSFEAGNRWVSRLATSAYLTHTSMQSLRASHGVVRSQVPVYVVLHICPKGPIWEPVLDEIVRELVDGGLYARATAVLWGCSCDKCSGILRRKFDGEAFSKFRELEGGQAPDEDTYECVTLAALRRLVDTLPQEAYVVYAHTKGIGERSMDSGNQHAWRRFMAHWLLREHEQCASILDRGLATVGTNLQKIGWDGLAALVGPLAYTGNFWWSDAAYLRSKHEIRKEDMWDRYEAERWLFQGAVRGHHASIGRLYLEEGLLSFEPVVSPGDEDRLAIY